MDQQPSQPPAATQQQAADRLQGCCYRPHAFDKMEGLVREMQDPENGVPVRSQKLFLTSIPSAFMGYDLIEWLMERLGIEESEALNIANQLCQYGYFFPVSDSKTLVVKDDSSLYRFQTPYYWPWQQRMPDNVDYAIYLAKRTLRNKQRHGLEEYELEALNNLRKNLQNKWDFIMMQAEEQVRLAKERKKGDKIVSDSQERAYWRVYRPPPGIVSSLEACPVPNRNRNGNRSRRRTLEDCKRDVEFLKNSLTRTRVKVSQALENMIQYVETYSEYDPLITQTQPSNPWVSEDITYWQLNSPLVEVPTEKRVKRWALSMEELVSDPTGLQEFTAYLRKEYSHENIRFWMATNDLRRSGHSQIQRKVQEIFEEFLAPGAPCEINIDGKTMEKVQQELKQPSRFTFDSAAEHVYTLLLKKDCYPRFIRSEHYKSLLASGIQPSHKKRFFGFGPTKKKTSTTQPPTQTLLQQQPNSSSSATTSGVSCGGGLSRRRGSDRSLSGSAHELAVCGVKDVGSRVPHSHSQSNLSDIPYRKKITYSIVFREPTTESGICPWDETPCPAPITTAAPSTTSTALVPLTTLPTVPITSIGIVESSANNKQVQEDSKKKSVSEDPGKMEKTTSSIASSKEKICEDTKNKDSVRSRKSSTALDSASSSSEISLAIVEVSDRLRKTVGITQQNTLDDSKLKSRRLSTSSELANQVRRSSISIIPPKYSDNTNSTTSSNKPLLSSFEENTGSCTVLNSSSNNINIQTSKPTSKNSSNTNISENTDNKNLNQIIENTCAPIISVSSVIDETIQEIIIEKENIVTSDPSQDKNDESSGDTTTPMEIDEIKTKDSMSEYTKNESVSSEKCVESIPKIEETIPIPKLELALAPLAVPDSESPCSECNPDISSPQDLLIKKDSASDTADDNNQESEIEVADKDKDIDTDKDKDTVKDTDGKDKIVKEMEIVKDDDKDMDSTDKDHQATSQDTSQQEKTTTSSDEKEKELKTQKSQENNSSTTIDSKQKEICPWEDEETCKHDVPFVKTYSTLGYL